MKYYPSILIKAIAGAIIGDILLLPFLGWQTYGHGLVYFGWTKPFMIVGIFWGLICGTVVGLISIMINSTIVRRVIAGVIVGGISGMIFYLVWDLAFRTDDSFLSTMSKSLFGAVFGVIAGGISALALGIMYWLLQWIRVKDESFIKGRLHRFKERILSSLVGLTIGSVIGGFLLLIIGQTKLGIYGGFHISEIDHFYLLPKIFGCATAFCSFVKPLPKTMLQKSIAGLRDGIILGLLSILYFIMIYSMILLFPFAKPELPELLEEDWLLLLNLAFSVVGIFTVIFGFICGITGATVEGIFSGRKS